MLDVVSIKDIGVLATLAGVIFTGYKGYIRLNFKVDNQTKDVRKNEERSEKRFLKIEEDIEVLENAKELSNTRLTQIESDSAHTRSAVDEMRIDLKEIMKQLTAVATTIATRKD